MAVLESPQSVAPVFDQQAFVVLGNIYNYLNKLSTTVDKASSDSTRAQDRIFAGIRDSATDANNAAKASQQNSRAVDKALKGISKNQDRDQKEKGRDRATEKALFGKMNNTLGKTNSLLSNIGSKLLTAFNNLKGHLTPYLQKTVNAQMELQKVMRLNFMTSAQKDQANAVATSAVGNAQAMFGMNLAMDEVTQFMSELIVSGKDLELMGSEQATAFAALRKMGIDENKAYTLAMSASTQDLKKVVTAAADPKVRATLTGAINGMEDYELAVGGLSSNLNNLVAGSQSAAKHFGATAAATGKTSEFVKQATYAASGQLEKISGDFAIMTGGLSDNVEDTMSNLDNNLKAATDTQRRLIGQQGGMMQDMANISADKAMMSAKGNKTEQTIRSDKENKAALATNTKDGQLQQLFDKLYSKLDKMTGGSLSKINRTLDEIFGGSVNIMSFLGGAFTIVGGLLKTLIFRSGGGFLGGILKTALLGGGIALVAELLSNSDKFGEFVKPIVDSVKSIIKNLPGILKTAISKIPELFSSAKGMLSGLFSSKDDGKSTAAAIKNGMSGLSGKFAGSKAAAGKVRDSVSVDSKSLKEGASSVVSGIGGAIKWIGNFLVEILKPIGGVIEHVVDAVVAIAEILKPIADAIGYLIVAIADNINPIIQIIQTIADAVPMAIELLIDFVDCVRELGVSIVDCIKELGVSLIESTRDVLVSISPAINSIGHAVDVLATAIAPVIPTIVDMLSFAVKTILPPVMDLLKNIVNNIFPQVLSLIQSFINQLMPIISQVVDVLLPPLIETITFAVESLIPPIVDAVNLIISLVDRIVNLILDVLEPPLRALSDLVTNVLGVINSIVSFVGDIVGVAHGMFNFFLDKLPNIIGWVSGIFSFISDYIFPIVKSGFKVLYGIVNTFYKGIKMILTVALTPIITIINGIDLAIKAIKYAFLAWTDAGNEEHDTAVARREMEESKLILEGHDASEETLALKRAYESYLERHTDSEGKSTIGDSGSAEFKEAERLWKKYIAALEQEKSPIEKAKDEFMDAGSELADAVGEFTGNISKAVNSGGPQFDQSAADSAKEYLSGNKGGISSNIQLPPNTGDMLTEIATCTKKTPSLLAAIGETVSAIANLLRSDKDLPKLGDGLVAGKATKAIIGEDGKEAVLPLTKPDELKSIISQLSDKEKAAISAAISAGATDVQVGEYANALKLLGEWKGGKLKQKDFIALFGPIAREDMRSTGIPASVTLAQAILESGWGKTAKADFRNLFGIKGKGDAGSAYVTTHEDRTYKGGGKEIKKDYFAQYSSYLESVKAHSRYLLNAQRKHKGLKGLRYGEALTHIFEPNLFAYLLREGGYATSSGYGGKLVGMMKGYNLYKWDVGPSAVRFEGIGSPQIDLLKQAKENLKNKNQSEARMQKLLIEEDERLRKKAEIEGKEYKGGPRKYSAGAVVDDPNAKASTMSIPGAGAVAQQVPQNIAEVDSWLEKRLNPNASKISSDNNTEGAGGFASFSDLVEGAGNLVNRGKMYLEQRRLYNEAVEVVKKTNNQSDLALLQLYKDKAMRLLQIKQEKYDMSIEAAMPKILEYLRKIASSSSHQSPIATRPAATPYR